MKLRLKDRVAIVTGGAGGIGRTYVLALAGEGAKIVIAEGVLLYVIETAPEQSFVLAPDFPGTVPPATPHHIAPNGPVRFHMEFHR